MQFSYHESCAHFIPRYVNSGLLTLLMLVAGSGCSGESTSDVVRPDLAKETLIQTLSAWKDGKTVDSLKSQSPSIVVQDMDWSAGKQLKEFSLQGGGKALGANLSVEVELTLQDADGRTSTSKVWYLVGTDPALTVFRDMFHP